MLLFYNVISNTELHLHLKLLSIHFIKSMLHLRNIYINLIFHPIVCYPYLSVCLDLKQMSKILNSFSSVNIKFMLHFFVVVSLASGSFLRIRDFHSLFIRQLWLLSFFHQCLSPDLEKNSSLSFFSHSKALVQPQKKRNYNNS